MNVLLVLALGVIVYALFRKGGASTVTTPVDHVSNYGDSAWLKNLATPQDWAAGYQYDGEQPIDSGRDGG